MPDWTYHPAYRPVVFRLPAESARRLTMGLLALQGRTKVGRELFRLLSYGLAHGHARAFGLTFPSPFGLGPDIDSDARAFRVLQYLGCGFLTAGPVCLAGRPRQVEFDPQRVPDEHALLRHTQCYSPSAAALHASFERREIIQVPIGVAIDDQSPGPVIRALDDRVDFYSLRGKAGAAAAEARAATKRPILLRVPLDGGPGHAVAEARRAQAAGLNGIVVGDGRSNGASGWLIDGAGVLPHVLQTVAAVRAELGKDFAIVSAGGVITPPDAMACVDSGADLVEIGTGFVYSGPGLIGRTVALEGTTESTGAAPEPPQFAAHIHQRDALLTGAWSGMAAAAAVGFALLPSDLLARIASSWPQLFPPAAAATPLATAGALAALAVLAAGLLPLARRGERWTSWLLALSSLCALPTLPALGGAGIVMVALGDWRDGWLRAGFRPLFGAPVTAWGWSAANLGKKMLETCTVLTMTALLAAQLPGTLRLSAAGAAACTFMLVGRGLRPGVRSLWIALAVCAAALVLLAAGLATSNLQRAGAGAAALAAVAGLLWLWGPLVKLGEGPTVFPDV